MDNIQAMTMHHIESKSFWSHFIYIIQTFFKITSKIIDFGMEFFVKLNEIKKYANFWWNQFQMCGIFKQKYSNLNIL